MQEVDEPLATQWVRWARLRYPILIRGERGTGKSSLAERLHRASGRPSPYVPRSLEAIPKGLEVAELLGHVKGAFTTSAADRPGILAQANGGTAFLDELGRATLKAQAALLGFLDRSVAQDSPPPPNVQFRPAFCAI